VGYSRLDGRRDAPDTPRLLGATWLARWRNSGSKYPAGLDEMQKTAVTQRIEEHPQFAPPT
jgi:queuine tRNA-ribosyltransferase